MERADATEGRPATEEPAAPAVLAVTDLSVSYGAVRAVRSVSLTVHRGEIVTLIGANGAGKTSVMNALMGLVPASGGTISLEGREVQGWPPERIVRSGMTLTPEGRYVFPDLTVRENLILGGATLRHRKSTGSPLEQVFELFPVLKNRQKQPAGTLSGGEQQQLAIARSLMSEPRILLLDEPSLGLAPKMVGLIFRLVEDLRGRGLTILLVEQNVTQTLEIADRAYVLDNGQIVSAGPASLVRQSEDIARAYLGL
jgi:branched-chain amino acid transport system ATP-binding protein